MDSNTHHNLFSIQHLCIPTLVTQTPGRIRTLYISNDCSTIEDIIFLCQSWIRDMIGKLWLQTLIAVLSDHPLVCAYTHNLKTTGCIWMFSISNDCCTIGPIPCMVQSCTRDPTGELLPQTCINHSLVQNGMRILQARTYMYNNIWCASTHDNKTHKPYDCILHTK